MLAKQGLSDAEWDALSTLDKSRHEWRAMFEEEKTAHDLTVVEFVRYDEKLYQALVEVGAAKVNKQQTGEVSIDPVELGYPAGLV